MSSQRSSRPPPPRATRGPPLGSEFPRTSDTSAGGGCDNASVRPVLVIVPLLAALLFVGSSGAVRQSATIGVYPSETTFRATSFPAGGGAGSVALNMPIGGRDDAVVLVHGAQQARVEAATRAAPLH